jgi:hypothetical protein
MLHGLLEGIRPAQLRVGDNKPDRPVYRDSQSDKKKDAGKQTRLFESIWLSDDAGTDDTVGHVHERALHATLWARGLEEIVRVEVFSRKSHTGRLNIRQKWNSVPCVAPLLLNALISRQVILFFDPFPPIDRAIWVGRCSRLGHIESYAVWRPGNSFCSRPCE